jgi:phosphoribosyl 1,2-cyclic phosphodiesterase
MGQENITVQNIQTANTSKFPKAVSIGNPVIEEQLTVRINGTLPDFSTLGNEKKSQMAAEVKRQHTNTNTSCSVLARIGPDQQIFHMLVDIGEGVVKSIENPDLGVNLSLSSFIPDALLITNSHDDHIKELPMLVNKINDNDGKLSKNLKIFCTLECRDQVIKKFPQLSEKTTNNNRVSFNIVQPDQTLEVGPFSVLPIIADHGDNSPPGSMIYIVKLLDKKIIIGWDFLSLPNADENLFWNPDLLILGTQSYNPHPQTGTISVSDAYEIIRRWNAKECYIVNYTGLSDFEEATNQWFRGPVKAMTTDELQRVIDSHLQVTGDNGKFRITAAKEGMVWNSKKKNEQNQQQQDESISSKEDTSSHFGKTLDIESLQKYVLKIENDDKNDRLKIEIQDRINRFNLEFVSPRKDKNNDDILLGQGVRGMMAKGPELRMEIVPSQSHEKASVIKMRVYKGKKNVFKDDIFINSIDAQRLRKYIKEKFVTGTK